MLHALHALIEQLCPEPCPRCGLSPADGFCGDCRREFWRVVAPCVRCGMPRSCAPCPAQAATWHIDRMNAPFVYAPPLARYLKALKYDGQRRLGRALGQLLAAEIACENLNVDRIVSVPLHPGRLRTRTFNQANEIARCLAAKFKWPLASGVRREIDTPPQAGLDRTQRQRFAGDAFSVRGNLRGLRIAVIDDVITTGATVNSLAGTLKRAGAKQVQAWAVARSVGEAAKMSQAARKI